jgi:hypothetical protein
MIRWLSRLFSALWPFGLFVFFVMLALSFEAIPEQQLAQIFGAVVIFCGAVAWLIADWVKPSQDRVNQKLAEIADLLQPYEGMSLKQMPPEVRAEVQRRLGWVAVEVKAPSAPPAGTPEKVG